MSEDPIPGEWRPDPAERHEYRFWSPTDGWTINVADHGVHATDPEGLRVVRAREREAAKQDKKAARREGRSILGVTLTEDGRIESRRQGSGPVAGATASVETQGDLERRITATRLALTGPFALAFRKKKDHRELHLLIEGRGFAIVEPVVPRMLERKARQFAATINAAARLAEAQETPAVSTASTLDQLEKLGQLHRDGVLTDDEFDEQKRKLLGS